MGKVREQKVTLVTKNGFKHAYGLKHAERILDMGDALNGGWSVDPSSPYYYDEENGLRLKTDKGNTAKS